MSGEWHTYLRRDEFVALLHEAWVEGHSQAELEAHGNDAWTFEEWVAKRLGRDWVTGDTSSPLPGDPDEPY